MLNSIKLYYLSLGFEHHIALFCAVLSVVLGVVVASWLANLITKRYLVRVLQKMLSKSKSKWGEYVLKHKIILKCSHLAPALVVYLSAPLIVIHEYAISLTIEKLIYKVVIIYIIIAIAMIVNATLRVVEDTYSHFTIANKRPIRSYIQVVRILIYIFTAIIVISTLIDKSPLVFLTGVGAMTAIIMLVFKDTILGLVASVQLTSYDMIRLGDWIDLPNYNASGDVIDISLGTIKIRNFDKTITTVPTHALLNTGIKNWRGMQESGGRRIKRSISLDMDSIKFCDANTIQRFQKIRLISKYLTEKIKEIDDANKALDLFEEEALINGRCLTNIGVFRQYIIEYLSAHPKVHKDYTFLIRQLQPTETGLPIEIYIFINDVIWKNYEAAQADIFDHILAAVHVFDLQVFSNTSGRPIDINLRDVSGVFAPKEKNPA